MSYSRRLGINTLWLLLMRFGTQGFMVLFTIILARRLGESGLGEYALMASAIFLGNVLTTFGTDMFLIREIAAGHGSTRLPAALVIQLVLSVLFISVIWAGALVLPAESQDTLFGLRIYSLSLLPLAFFTVFTTALRGRERMDLYTLLNVAVSLLQFILVLFFVQADTGIVTLAILLVIVQLAAAILAGVLCLTQIPDILEGWHLSIPMILSLARVSAPIALLGVLGIVYQRLGIYMLSALSGVAITGWFSAALRVVEASKIGHIALFSALYPAMARVWNQSSGEKQTMDFMFSWWVLMAASVSAALFLFFLAAPLINLLYGAAFIPSIPALKIIAWTMVPYTINIYLSMTLLAAGREHAVARILFASVVMLLALNLWWIPRAGLSGACWSALVVESIQAGLFLAHAKGKPFSRQPERIGFEHEFSKLSR